MLKYHNIFRHPKERWPAFHNMAKAGGLVVVAFDFGTTFSGYAFSFRNEPSKVQTNGNWVAGSEKLMSLKTPTCVLLNKDDNFHSFGFEAENKYSALAEDGNHHGWKLFRHFKMVLHSNEVCTFVDCFSFHFISLLARLCAHSIDYS